MVEEFEKEVGKQQTLLFLVGLPASGKSTFANQYVIHKNNVIIVNRDKIREMLKGTYNNFPFGTKMEQLVTEIENATIYNALKQGYSVISDNTNFRLSEQDKQDWQRQFPHVDISVMEFHGPLEELIERDKQRDKTVGEQVIRRMYSKYINK